MGRASPNLAVLMQVTKPFIAVSIENIRLIAVLKKTDVRVEVILDVISRTLISIALKRVMSTHCHFRSSKTSAAGRA